MSQYFFLFKNRTFSLFFFGNAISLFGWGLNFIAGLCAFFLPVIQSLAIAMSLYFVMGLHNNSARIISRTILMENIPNDVIGRVHNFLGIITRIFVVSSAILVGWIAETYSVESALLVTAGFFWISLLGVIITNKFSPKILE